MSDINHFYFPILIVAEINLLLIIRPLRQLDYFYQTNYHVFHLIFLMENRFFGLSHHDFIEPTTLDSLRFLILSKHNENLKN